MASAFDSFDLAARQNALDREATARMPQLFARKRRKLLAGPLGLLRGSAPLFYEILRADPDLAAGPEGDGHLVGDMHIENVGAVRTDADDVRFDLNDFDDAAIAAWRFDVVRLATSVLLAGRYFRATASESLALVDAVLQAYVQAAFFGVAAPPQPQPVRELCEHAKKRSRKDLLDERAPGAKGRRAFIRGDRYLELDGKIAAAVPGLVASYVEALGPRAPNHAREWKVVDAAQRVAGTGSLGKRRIAVLVADGRGTERIFELKEAGPSALGPWNRLEAASDAERVVAGARALVREPTRQLVALPPSEHGSFIGRKLCPEEDKLDLARLQVGERLSSVARTVGHVLGAAHARGATQPPTRPWTADDLSALTDRAVRLAGIHESVYLAYARLATR